MLLIGTFGGCKAASTRSGATRTLAGGNATAEAASILTRPTEGSINTAQDENTVILTYNPTCSAETVDRVNSIGIQDPANRATLVHRALNE